MNCEKQVKDGKVAVLYHNSFGAGWYTWNSDVPELLYDKDLVELALVEDFDKLENLAKEKYPGIFSSAAKDGLKVEWLDIGTQFRIDEYDGRESIILLKTCPVLLTTGRYAAFLDNF